MIKLGSELNGSAFLRIGHPTVEPIHPTQSPAISCAACGRVLTAKREYAVLPGIGTLGPECEQKLMAASIHLRAAGLGELLNYGSMTIELTADTSGFCTPGHHPTFVRLNTAAQGAGFKINFRTQRGERRPEMVLFDGRISLPLGVWAELQERQRQA